MTRKRTTWLVVIALLLVIAAAVIYFISRPQTRNHEQSQTSSQSSTASKKVNSSFGAHTYNTPQMAKEMRWINDNVKADPAFADRRVFITGSTAGLGELAANYLVRRGFQVVAHARNEARARDVRRDIPGLKAVVIGDLNNLQQTRSLAQQVNRFGRFDVIIQNAGVYGAPSKEMLNVNALSPFMLASLIHKPRQMIFLSSDLQSSGSISRSDILSNSPHTSYGDTKLYLLTLSNYLARHWSDVQVNAVTPGWVPTKMGFADGNTTTPNTLKTGYMTQVMLAEGRIRFNGRFLFKQHPIQDASAASESHSSQQQLIDALSQKTGVSLPR